VAAVEQLGALGRAFFEEAGYVALAPKWPDDPETVAEANQHPDVFAKKTVGTDRRLPGTHRPGAEPKACARRALVRRAARANSCRARNRVGDGVDLAGADRGGKDHTVPASISKAAFKHQQGNVGVTEFVEMSGRGHALTVDHGWREVAENAMAFIHRFV
jgi:hypothetical protein